jgi:hypothetical protein
MAAVLLVIDAGVRFADVMSRYIRNNRIAQDGATYSTGGVNSGVWIDKGGINFMSIVFLIIVIVLFVGPLRRPFLRHGRFTIPCMIGIFIGLGIGAAVALLAGLPEGLAGLVGIVTGIGLGCSLGEGFKNWCDRIFGIKEQKDRD